MPDQENAPERLKKERMFLGEHERSLDDKGRITLPAAYREILGNDGGIITRGLDRCIFLFPGVELERWTDKISKAPHSEEQAREFRRFIFSGANEAVPDGQGRIIIPLNLRQYAGLKRDVVVAGSANYAEIWDAEAWKEKRVRMEANGDNAAAWRALGI